MPKTLNYRRKKILHDIDKLPEDKIVEIEDFIEFIKEKYLNERNEESKGFELQEKQIITSPNQERLELEKTGKYSKDFLDQFERSIAKSSIYSK